jgi:hypothetical protein
MSSLFVLCIKLYLLLGKYKHLFVALLIGLLGGMFGYSTLVMVVVPGVVLGMIFMNWIIRISKWRVRTGVEEVIL